jgi:heme oxygenase (biliverdin-IX-beta and delta-forming)
MPRLNRRMPFPHRRTRAAPNSPNSRPSVIIPTELSCSHFIRQGLEILPETVSQPACPATQPRAFAAPSRRVPLLDRLRDETSSQHQRVENRLDLLRPDLSLAAYAGVLGRLYGFYSPWQSRIAGTAPLLLPDWAVRQEKLQHLASDLAYLDVNVAALPLCQQLPAYETASAVLGGLYVIEGATLGGQIISRHLQRSFHFPNGRGDTFFQSYGANVGRMWSSFREALSGYSSPCADDEIVRAAQNTFLALETWLGEAPA